MSKLSFRARALDASKPMPVYLAEELPDLPDYSAINRAVPQMPSGMEKEEECEHHLQRAICAGLIIPTPEVAAIDDADFYDRCYPHDYKMPRQMIHMQPLCLEQEVPEYDMDSDDERWLRQQRHSELTELKFEEIMDRLERSSGQTVVTLNEAKLLLDRHDDLVIAVYDYWLNKRLKTQHPLVLSVRTESRAGVAANNPYLAFRRRTEKMQTRKNRKNDEASYEKMVKLRRELARAAALLELVARRERAKRELVRLAARVADARYRARDYAGRLVAELAAARTVRSSYPPMVGAVAGVSTDASSLPSSYSLAPARPYVALTAPRTQTRSTEPTSAGTRQREKRQYKKRKHRHHGATGSLHSLHAESGANTSSSEETSASASASVAISRASPVLDGPFAFRRKSGCMYHMPTPMLRDSDLYQSNPAPSWDTPTPHSADKRFRYTLTSISQPYQKCVGFARRRMGRGGRVVLDRAPTPLDPLWQSNNIHNVGEDTRSGHDRKRELDERLCRDPQQLLEDFKKGAKHPWRDVFNEHRDSWSVYTQKSDESEKQSEKPTEIVNEGVKVKIERCELDADVDTELEIKPKDVCWNLASASDSSLFNDFSDSNRKRSGDISFMLNGNYSENFARRGLNGFRHSGTGRHADIGLDRRLDEAEEKFSRFLDEVKKEWLHFRPKTPPEQDRTSSGEILNLGDSILGETTPITVEIRTTPAMDEPPSKCFFDDTSPFVSSEFTLADLYGESVLPVHSSDSDISSNSLEISGDDTLALLDNFSGLTDAQVDSILSESQLTDLKNLHDDLPRKGITLLPDDGIAPLQDIIMKGDELSDVSFLSKGQSVASGGPGRADAISGPHRDRRKRSNKLGSTNVRVLRSTEFDDRSSILISDPAAEKVTLDSLFPNLEEKIKQMPQEVVKKPEVVQLLKPSSNVAVEEDIKVDVEEISNTNMVQVMRTNSVTIPFVQSAIQLPMKTQVQNKSSPAKRHIITNSVARARMQDVQIVDSPSVLPQQQLVTVAVSESLKVRLQNHLLQAAAQQQAASESGSVPIHQNGPFSNAGSIAVAMPTVSVSSGREVLPSVVSAGNMAGTRRVITSQSGNVMLHTKAASVVSVGGSGVPGSAAPPIVVPGAGGAQLQHKLKLLQQHLPGVVKAGATHFFEIKQGVQHINKGGQLVNVVSGATPGRHVVRAAPHQIQIQKGAPALHLTQAAQRKPQLLAVQRPTLVTQGVVANILHSKSGVGTAVASGGAQQKITISSANAQALAALTAAAQQRQRQARQAAASATHAATTHTHNTHNSNDAMDIIDVESTSNTPNNTSQTNAQTDETASNGKLEQSGAPMEVT